MLPNAELQQIKNKFGIIGNNPEFLHAINVAVQVAPTDLSVLITGESGVGKENFPKIIHQYSQRKHEKYIAVNCGAIPEGTIDSELFGHEKGSFTGALTDRKGYFEEANGGTIFLDEVGELPLSTQARLLRILEVGEFFKVGSSKVQKTNVRIIAATNVNIEKAIEQGKFREDLYYRLNATHIEIPALRNRKEDIYPLFTKFANDFSLKYQRPSIKLSEDAINALKDYYWRGNIRQLKNIAEQISAIETEPFISLETIQSYLPDEPHNRLPQHIKGKGTQSAFNPDPEMLFKAMIEMKKDIEKLKGAVKKLLEERGEHIAEPINALPAAPEFIDVEVSEAGPTLSVENVQKELIKKVLKKHGGRKDLAAIELKMSTRTLYRKIKEYGIEE
ncbi:MAG: sigma-54 dependent transcriptional regulator [Paludibacteraceae bacterium]|nr:sigma-54 dependent transcriptional regulator [Paludibacteraceae bacterium]